MTEPKATGLSRRAVAAGGGIAAALGIAAIAVTGPRLWGGYPSTEYDDLLQRLVDRDQAIRVGKALRQGGVLPDTKRLAHDLRQRFERRSMDQVIDSDLAQGHLREASGWVLPDTLALLCVLAADVS